MSLTTTLSIGTALGGAAAVAIYTAVVPMSATPVARTQSVSVQAVPTPTKTVLEPCDKGAVLVKGECIVHVPGAVIVAPAASSGSSSSGSRSSSPTSSTAPATSAYDDHESEDHGSDGEDHGGSEPGDD